MTMTLAELASRIGAELAGDGSVSIRGVAPIDRAEPGEVTFLANARYTAHLPTTKASAVIIGQGIASPPHLARLEAEDPYFAFRQALVLLHGERVHPGPADAVDGADISPGAVIHPEATIGEGSLIHPGVVIERGASIGRGSVLYPGAYVGVGASLGEECVLFPNAVIYDGCRLGRRVTIHANAVIGSDGFGYATHKGRHEKIPQTGIVVIEDEVEIGSGCVIERAAMEETRIGAGTKFADLISIGHGTRIGRGCLLVSLVGISGSVEVGDFVAFGGQVGVTGHLSIGDGARIAAKAAVVTDIPAGARVAGVPAIDLEAAKRNALAGRDLYGMARRLRDLERQIQRMQQSLGSQGAAAPKDTP
ncbi:MAG: UDP-3-O-(3-hydroxymyristoyl)glucosamine N-acyltransferase [Phycisphaeraceae bacterium]|nr:UDP-3-O-(3-hydroxymyristoyl)glucosamine N-acyltransferase [Phycisphaeraceae bacterium]